MKGQGIDTEAALAYSFPFAILVQFLITGIYTIPPDFRRRQSGLWMRAGTAGTAFWRTERFSCLPERAL